MTYTEAFVSSIKSIFTHKLRSFLTLSGLLIGVAAVTLMFSSVEAAKTLIQEGIKSTGYDNLIIISASYPERKTSPLRRYKPEKRFRELRYDDYENLRKKLPEIEFIYPQIQYGTTGRLNNQKSRLRLTAINNDYFFNKGYLLESGRWFFQNEEENAENVCVIGVRLRERFFPAMNPLGKYIYTNDQSFRIVGVIKELPENEAFQMGNQWERRRDYETCFLPAKTGAKHFRSHMQVDNIVIKTRNDADVPLISSRAKQILLAHHSMADDFQIEDINRAMLQVRAEIDDFMKNWNIILLCISGISLLTGGIGLFSILLISIGEKMKEIGVRKSVGATNHHIFMQFILESMTMAVVAGIAGALISYILVYILITTQHLPIHVPFSGLLVGIGFAAVVGLISGIYPAYKAAKIDPIRAIFYNE